MQIAIDGPAGAGKSTVSKALASKLGFIYVDTGALYRAIAYKARQGGVEYANAYDYVKGFIVELVPNANGQRVIVGGEDVTDFIRTPEMSRGASAVSAVSEIRGFLLETQRGIARNNNVVMDGRDIGTVILPNAEVKIYLDASAEIRADRRYAELREKGEPVSYDEVLADIKKRDYDDTHRAIAPLKKADGAIYVDSSGLSQKAVIEKLLDIVKLYC